MQLTDKIKGPFKIRTIKMIRQYGNGDTMDEIGKRFGVSGTRVQQILYKYRDLLEADKKYEKAKRINQLKRWLKNNPKTTKDAMDVQGELRKEIEGDDKGQGNSDKQIIIVYPPSHKPEEVNADRTKKISSSFLTVD